MSKIIMAFQVIPKVADDQIYAVVDRAIEVVKKSGVPYQVGPMETTMEGEPDQLWEIIKEAQAACIEGGATRVMTHVKIDFVPSGSTIEEKIAKYRTPDHQ